MPRVLLNFQLYNDPWSVHFIEADCKTGIGPTTRYYHFATLDGLRSFVIRCNPENMTEFERSVRAWNRGSNFVNVTDEQYGKLKTAPGVGAIVECLRKASDLWSPQN
jgi:hypothetical protein